jgi:Mn2+/Fe2+ NRAMP family transporter
MVSTNVRNCTGTKSEIPNIAEFGNLRLWHPVWRSYFVKPSSINKGLLLIVGIVVAIIISLTTWLHSSSSQAVQIRPPIPAKSNISEIVQKAGRAFIMLNRQRFQSR